MPNKLLKDPSLKVIGKLWDQKAEEPYIIGAIVKCGENDLTENFEELIKNAA